MLSHGCFMVSIPGESMSIVCHQSHAMAMPFTWLSTSEPWTSKGAKKPKDESTADQVEDARGSPLG